MERRDFIRAGVIGGIAGAMVPKGLLAGSVGAATEGRLAGSVYFTGEHPGRWAKKARGHVPRIESSTAADGTVTVKVSTNHPMKGYKHYIVKHVLLDGNLELIGETMFDPMKDEPESEYSLKNYQGTVYALSMCNKHDLWLNGAEV